MNKQFGFAQGAVIALIFGLIVVIGAVWAVSRDNAEPEAMMESENDGAMMENDGQMMDKDTQDTMMDDGQMTDDAGVMMDKPGAYKDYSPDVAEAEQRAGNKVVLFFHAPWCPFCKAADSAFKSRINEIPSGITVLKTDYDSSIELKQKYGVTYQHTFVQIDNDENQVSKWNGGDIENVKKYVK